jgi:hypothetical protein
MRNEVYDRVIEIRAEDLIEIIPLTNDAKRSLNPTTERLHLKLSNPRWENEWANYVDKAILNDRLLAARKFASFFDISFLNESLWTPELNTYQFIISDIGVGQSQIEKQMEFADLGVLEFCIRIANNHDKTWREKDNNYSLLKSLRLKYLSSLNKKDLSFIDSSEICNALQLFEMELLGYILDEDDFEVVPTINRTYEFIEIDEAKIINNVVFEPSININKVNFTFLLTT